MTNWRVKHQYILCKIAKTGFSCAKCLIFKRKSKYKPLYLSVKMSRIVRLPPLIVNNLSTQLFYLYLSDKYKGIL